MNAPSSTTSSASSIRLNEVITLTVPTKTYDGSSSRSSLKKRKVCRVTSSSDQLIERLTAFVSDHEEEAASDVLSVNDTATRVDDVNDWDWMMGGKKDSYMLIAGRLGKSGSRQGQEELRNEEWGGEHSTSPVTLTPELLNRVRKNSFVARSA